MNSALLKDSTDHLADSDPAALLRFDDMVVDEARRLPFHNMPTTLSPRPVRAAAVSAFV